jgi:hypothetical protein
MKVNLENTYWERIKGYVSELRVDARWLLRKHNSKRTFGSLRIVSHPDLKPGQLRAIFTYVTDIIEKTDEEIIKTIEDYQMDVSELEVYSVDENLETESDTYEAPFKELEELLGVKIFE